MIKKLNNKDRLVAEQMSLVFQASYTVEAKILKAVNFPPLSRSVEDYMECNSEFFGYANVVALVGIVEVIHTEPYTLIRSLVVDPAYFRKGIGSQLMNYVLDSYTSDLFIVETGLENEPALRLYNKMGFVLVDQWDTDHGVVKVKLEKR